MSGFQTAARPRPVFSTNRPQAPVVPFSRVGREETGRVVPPSTDKIVRAFRLVCSMQGKAPPKQELVVEPLPRPTLRIIAEHVANDFGVSVHELKSMRRTAVLVGPRQAMFWLARELTGHSLPSIGRAYGGKDHTTVLNGIKRTEERMRVNPDYRAAVVAIRERLEVKL